jgi:hypothetical protein
MSSEQSKTIELPHGRSLAIAGESQCLRIADANGMIELEIDLRESGPVVRVRAAALQIETAGDLSLGCERFELRARAGIRLASDRDLTASVAGDLDCRAAGHAHWEGRSVRLRSHREVQIEAADDVRLDGERILLNS